MCDPARAGSTATGSTSPTTRTGSHGIGTMAPDGPGSGHARSQPLSSYPGSVAVGGHGAQEGEHTLVSSSSAVLFSTYCTTARPPELTRWFASELRHDGWTAESHPVGTTGNDVVATAEWRRGERRFTLHLLSPAYVGRVSAARGTPCSSGYRTVVQ